MTRESFRHTTQSRLELAGLQIGAPQTMGTVRMVPLVRDRFLAVPGTGAGAGAGGADNAPQDLRIAARDYRGAYAVVEVGGGTPDGPGLKYMSFVPHGFIVSYTEDGSPVAAQGASFGPAEETRKRPFVRLMHRMVHREDGEGATARFRMLPLHLAMEGFLALHFNGPNLLWSQYSETALRSGLDPRVERSIRGAWLPGLEEAVRTFEILHAQVGVMVFVADALAAAFVVPHPDDYRRLHRTLLDDIFGELLLHYAILYPDAAPVHAPLDGAGVKTLRDLQLRVARVRADWRTYGELLSAGLFGRAVMVEQVRDMGPFRLERFVPTFDPSVECHIGERIVRDDGSLEYLKTYRLSAIQVKRAYLLQQLAAAQWSLDGLAQTLGCKVAELIVRLTNAGFGYLLKPTVLHALPNAPRR
ncbi:MAG TPA: hypothetical protein VH165_33150 [Kofleriaceae bacterium]|nr:hypothetical protein [Kofleriaceae bacterium]